MELHFHNGIFTVLQVSDPQDLQYVRKTMLWMLEHAYKRVNPDFVLFTGDNILGNHLWDARLISRLLVHDKPSEARAMKKAIDLLVRPVVKHGFPFSMIFGNHDDRNRHTKEEQAAIFRSYPGVVGISGDEQTGDCDTCRVPVLSEDGKKTLWNLWLFDSAWYDSAQDKCFERIKPQSVQWFQEEAQKQTAQNGGTPVPGLLFLHIPLPAALNLTEPCGEKDAGAVPVPGGGFCRLKSGVQGIMGEYPGVVETDSGLFNALKEKSGVKAVVSGHDHPNSFTGTVDGVDIVQTAAASFRCYGSRARGVRVFTLHEDGSYETQALSYAELCGKGLLPELRYLWDADGMGKRKAALIAGAAGVLLAAAGVTAALLR